MERPVTRYMYDPIYGWGLEEKILSKQERFRTANELLQTQEGLRCATLLLRISQARIRALTGQTPSPSPVGLLEKFRAWWLWRPWAY